MKSFICSLIVFIFGQNSYAEILEIYTWKPYPGKAEQLVQDMNEAAKIHSELGITVTISALSLGTTGDVDYVMSYEDLESWGSLKDASLKSTEWNAFLAKTRSNPSGELVDSFSMSNHDLLNRSNPFSEPGQVVAFFRWEPAPGAAGSEALRQGFAAAKVIHESLGARVETYQIMNGRDGVRDMMYIMIYNNYSHMASVNEQMLTNSEWIAFQQEANSQPSQAATLLRSGIANMAGYFE